MFQLKQVFKSAKRGLARVNGSCKRAFASFMLGAMYGVQAFAQSKGAGGFSSATTEINSYATPVKNLMYAIAAVIALVQNGDQDVKKTIMMTIGGCVAMVAMATALPMFFK